MSAEEYRKIIKQLIQKLDESDLEREKKMLKI